jgi:hypothetical protein
LLYRRDVGEKGWRTGLSAWSNFDCRDRETDTDSLGFIETTAQLELHSGIEFGAVGGAVKSTCNLD